MNNNDRNSSIDALLYDIMFSLLCIYIYACTFMAIGNTGLKHC